MSFAETEPFFLLRSIEQVRMIHQIANYVLHGVGVTEVCDTDGHSLRDFSLDFDRLTQFVEESESPSCSSERESSVVLTEKASAYKLSAAELARSIWILKYFLKKVEEWECDTLIGYERAEVIELLEGLGSIRSE